jgi:hypothetical protein
MMPSLNGTEFFISETLLQCSDRTFVDDCQWSFNPETAVFNATFISERFAKCLVSKQLSKGAEHISDDELQEIALLASEELERQTNEMGMMAVFNQSHGTSSFELPQGFTLEVIYEDEQTNPSAPGIDWLAIA